VEFWYLQFITYEYVGPCDELLSCSRTGIPSVYVPYVEVLPITTILNLSYDGVSKSVSPSTYPVDIEFNLTGSLAFVLNGASPSSLQQYTLAEPYDIANMVLVESVSMPTYSNSISFSPDGLHMFLSRDSTELIQYSLGVAWDITTLGYIRSKSGFINEMIGFDLIDDGSGFIVHNGSAGLIQEYLMDPPFDLSTATLSASSFSPVAASVGYKLSFNVDESAIILLSSWDVIELWDLSEKGDISTATFNSNLNMATSISPDPNNLEGIAWDALNQNFYLVGSGTEKLFEFPINS